VPEGISILYIFVASLVVVPYNAIWNFIPIKEIK